jgi:hypothetical protein
MQILNEYSKLKGLKRLYKNVKRDFEMMSKLDNVSVWTKPRHFGPNRLVSKYLENELFIKINKNLF